MLITERYLRLQRKMHKSGDYGRAGDRWLAVVEQLVTSMNAKDVLDYGCGKGALALALAEKNITCREYDPAIAGKDVMPRAPADIVVCADVLEHIEPECLESVLLHLHSLTRMTLFAVISTRKAGKVMADGRNAHLIVESGAWWRNRLCGLFEFIESRPAFDQHEHAWVMRPL